MKIARDLERKTINIHKHKEHLTFNHTLKRTGILPTSLRFNPPVRCREGFEIVRKTGWSFVKLRIQHGHERIKELEIQRTDCCERLSNVLTDEYFDALRNVTEHNAKKSTDKVKTRHLYKLANLGAFKNNYEDYIDKNRWVLNLSDRQLTNHEVEALRNGLNFATTPKTVPIPSFVANIETGIHNLPEDTKATIRASVVNILKNSKPPKANNINNQQKIALRNLKQDSSINIIPADKGKAVVVMNTDDYEEKIKSLLSDEATYLRISDKRRNPTSRVEKDLNKLLQEIKSKLTEHDRTKHQIQDRLYYHLRITDASAAVFYGLPKIHKPEVPLRPITSCINFPTYKLSKHLVSILSPLLNNEYSVRNSVEFAQKIKNKEISQDEIMISFDVISLFTSIPVELALQVIKRRLQEDKNLTDRTDISIANILRLLEFVLTNSFFTYKGDYYKQIFGCAMGSPISATIANIVMEHIEDLAILSAPNPPKWWFRFVDDSHACIKTEHVQEFHDHINSVNPHIQFTIETEKDNQLPFLDTMTTRKQGRIQIDIYRKPTHTDKYLDYNSHHPIAHKQSVVNTLLDRAEKIPSSKAGKRRERKHVMKVLRENGYSYSFIKRCDSKRQKTNNNDNKMTEESSSNFVLLPYVKGISERITKVLRRENVKVGFKPINTIGKRFPKPKDKLQTWQMKGVIYEINCLDCNFVYIGQTDRALRTRIKEHRRAVNSQDKNSKIAQHANTQKHNMDFDNTTIIDKEANYHKRLFLEAWHSQRNSNAGNDHIDIPNIYISLS